MTIDYFRKSVRETVLTYPLLAGIGITAGEEMRDRKDEFAKEPWLWKTYGEGIRDALKLQPGRDFRLIHRYHQTALPPILEAFKTVSVALRLELQVFGGAHAVVAGSAVRQGIARGAAGESAHVDDGAQRRHLQFPLGRPGIRARRMSRICRDPTSSPGSTWVPTARLGPGLREHGPETPRPLVIEKQWFSFMLWGRLSYEPSLPDALFERTLAQRFPGVPAAKLLLASEEASQIIPQVTRFFWGDIDLKWFPEACLSHPRHKGFYTVKHFIEGESMPGAGVLNIRTWRDRLRDGKPMEGITPLQVAAALQEHAAATLKLVAELRPANTKELRLTLGDYEAMAHLGNYYAEKILGAAQLALYDTTGAAERKQEAIAHLTTALAHWKRYAAAATAQYKPQLFNRVGNVDLNALTAKVAQDIALADGWQRAR